MPIVPSMEGRARRLLCGCAVTVAFAALWFAAPASAHCAHSIGDPAPGYSGSVEGISCRYEDGTPEEWTVPSGVSEATFSVRGADDASGAGGGHVEARLSLVPGETLTLAPGANGEATVVSRGGSDLFVGGGGNGDVPNYVTPAATDVGNEAPGGPFHLVVNGAPVRSDGQVSVEWGSITKNPTTTEVVVPGWKVTRVSGRRTITLAWPIQECIGLPEPQVSHIEVAWGREKQNGKFPAVITVFVSRTSSSGYPCAGSGMSKRIKLARPLSKLILLDGSTKPPRRETIPNHFSPLKVF
jgi:hypothetical protein